MHDFCFQNLDASVKRMRNVLILLGSKLRYSALRSAGLVAVILVAMILPVPTSAQWDHDCLSSAFPCTIPPTPGCGLCLFDSYCGDVNTVGCPPFVCGWFPLNFGWDDCTPVEYSADCEFVFKFCLQRRCCKRFRDQFGVLYCAWAPQNGQDDYQVAASCI